MKLTNYIEDNDFIVKNEEDYYKALGEINSIKGRLVVIFETPKNFKLFLEKNHNNNAFLFSPFAPFIKIICKVETDLREEDLLQKNIRRGLTNTNVNRSTFEKLLRLYFLGSTTEFEVQEYIFVCTNNKK